ncbi:MAG: hypothetical protein IPQ09_13760 [Myxococcales bacterium]|nr:hypothetical protein [Myxococcales bacterium]
MRLTKRKSLKWPDWSAASCRLSVNPRSLRVCVGSPESFPCIQRSALDTSTVVAELRPSADSEARRVRSRADVACVVPQRRQNRKRPGMNQAFEPEPSLPFGATMTSRARALR